MLICRCSAAVEQHLSWISEGSFTISEWREKDKSRHFDQASYKLRNLDSISSLLPSFFLSNQLLNDQLMLSQTSAASRKTGLT